MTNTQVSDENVKLLSDFCQKSDVIMNKCLAKKMISGKVPDLLAVATKSPRDRGLAEVILHFNIVMYGIEDNKLLQPLINLIVNPETMKNAYLPAMPQDELDEISEILAQSDSRKAVFYCCPNGHPYVIGDCGKPWVEGVCPACNAIIGGKGHELVESNSLIFCDDEKQKGYILGAPQYHEPVAIRQMTVTTTSIVRLFVHMSMYLGAVEQAEVVSELCKPAVDTETVAEFLWKHMQYNIDSIAAAI
jgi:hypothetical protein